jgi:hypothetical protein
VLPTNQLEALLPQVAAVVAVVLYKDGNPPVSGRGNRTLVDGPVVEWVGDDQFFFYVYNRVDDGMPPATTVDRGEHAMKGGV